tara:strand:+ start:879 stop:1286 length:408 start_codon:yes stop_codon:yes gene_type:complete
MKKSELREIIKPMVEECLQESMQKILLESGLLSAVISEVVAGLNTAAPIVEQKQPAKVEREPANKESNSQKINETRKRMLDAIGKDAYSGVNVFEGTKPSIPDSGKDSGPFKDTDPNDSGVDIGSIFNSNWEKLI